VTKNFRIEGTYFDGSKNREYSFEGRLIFLEEDMTFPYSPLNLPVVQFIGFINDGRCPAEVLDGQMDNNSIRFVKRYRCDEVILDHPFFKNKEYSELSLGTILCDLWPGIRYYGRIIKTEKNRIEVEGLYNSLIVAGSYSFHDRRIQKIVVSSKGSLYKEYEEKIKEICKDGNKEIGFGPWKMTIYPE